MIPLGTNPDVLEWISAAQKAARKERRMITRIYTVTNRKTGDIRMVEAPTRAQAVRFVVQDTLDVKVPTTKEVAALIARGVKCETAGKYPVLGE